MTDMEMIFLYKNYFREVDLSFLEGADKKAREGREKNEDSDAEC